MNTKLPLSATLSLKKRFSSVYSALLQVYLSLAIDICQNFLLHVTEILH